MENVLLRPRIEYDSFLARDVVGDLSDDTRSAVFIKPAEEDHRFHSIGDGLTDMHLKKDFR